MIVSKWNDKRLRVGWTIRLNNGQLAVITDVFHNGYLAKPIETLLDAKPTEQAQEQSHN